MYIYLSCSKTMTDTASGAGLQCTEPWFDAQAAEIAAQMSTYSVAEIQKILKVNANIARQTFNRYREFQSSGNTLPAILAYTGTAYRQLKAESFTPGDFEYATSHMLMGSFLYGLLRPTDCIHTYRLEGDVELPTTGHKNLFDFWRPVITDRFIETVKADDGVLLNLASLELQKILDWKKVTRELEVISPTFKVRYEAKPVTVSLYAKMCRGAMARHVICNRINTPDGIKDFDFNGFTLHDGWDFVLDP